MAEYAKPWLPIEEQITKLASRGVEIGDEAVCALLLRAVGYYRLTGYLYPFRESELVVDDDGRARRLIHNQYRPGTSIALASALIDFDRQLRLVVLDGVERIEISLRTQVAYVLGRRSAFAHLDPGTFVASFTDAPAGSTAENPLPSKHEEWIGRIRDRQDGSDEAFVAHFRNKYDDQMPIWALTEIMEMGHLARLFGGLQNSLATEIATEYGAPSKKVMGSWVASLNYVRNVAAHHARLFNRKLVVAPSRPVVGHVPLLDHLRGEESAKKVFGLYNALAVMAYLLRSIDEKSGWPGKVKSLFAEFPESLNLDLRSIGVPDGWEDLQIWQG